MKNLSNILCLFITFLICNQMQAQPGHNIVKPPKVNIPRVINIPKVKIHANSNSVYGNGNSHPDYNKKSQPKKEEIKNEEEGKKDKPRKQKK